MTKSIELGPPTSRAFFFPLDHRGYEIWDPLPPRPRPTHRSFADPFGNILGSKCTDATIRPNFFRFFLFCIAFGSFLFVVLFFFFSPFKFLLIHLFLSFSSSLPLLILLVGTMLCLLILVFSYYKLFVVLQTWYVYPSFWGFFEGAKPFFIHLGSK